MKMGRKWGGKQGTKRWEGGEGEIENITALNWIGCTVYSACMVMDGKGKEKDWVAGISRRHISGEHPWVAKWVCERLTQFPDFPSLSALNSHPICLRDTGQNLPDKSVVAKLWSSLSRWSGRPPVQTLELSETSFRTFPTHTWPTSPIQNLGDLLPSQSLTVRG